MLSIRFRAQGVDGRAVPPDCSCPATADILLEPHAAAIHVVASRILKSPDLACDAVQDSLIALWQLDDPPSDVRGWLVRTVVHKCLHVLRRENRRTRHEERASAKRSESCPLCDPAVTIEELESRARLEAAIEALSHELRATFRLRSERGLEYEEIARELGVPVGTVRSRLARARASLHDQLAEFVV